MSQIPIETNFTGIQKRLVPKCLVVDIYNLQLNPTQIGTLHTIQIDPTFPQTLCVLAGGSIITNIQIISPIILTNFDGIPIVKNVPYVILFQAGTKFDTEIQETGNIFQIQFGNLNSILQLSYGDFGPQKTCNNEIYQKLGAPFSLNSQIYIIGLYDANSVTSLQFPHIQCLIEYLAEENNN